MEDARNKSFASRMRFLGPTEGNSAKQFTRQLPLLGFGWVGDSLLKGTLSDIAAGPSREIAVTERESSDRQLRFHEEWYSQPCGTTPRFLLTLSIAIMRSKYHVLFPPTNSQGPYIAFDSRPFLLSEVLHE
jgi:hypothetical protein